MTMPTPNKKSQWCSSRNGTSTEPVSKSAHRQLFVVCGVVLFTIVGLRGQTVASEDITPKSTSATPPPTSKAPPNSHRTLVQEVEIIRRPRFSIQGLTTAQEIRYRLISWLDVESQADGSRKVLHYIQDTQLIAADELSRETFAKSLERLKSQQLAYTVNSLGEVIEFTGHKNNLKAIAVDAPALQGFAVTSVIDQDGWKELAALTFLIPDPKLKTSAKTWHRPMNHDWGPLGSWSGSTTLKRRGTVKGIQEIEYSHYMHYTKPGAAGEALPFKITDARFEPQKAGGRLEFDTQKQQVRLVQEAFEVRGVVTAVVLGQSLEIQLSEQQLIEIRIRERKSATDETQMKQRSKTN
jgi:hypothetical protein